MCVCLMLMNTRAGTSDRGSPCRWPAVPAPETLPPWRTAPPWTSSQASAYRDDSAWASPRASWGGLLSAVRTKVGKTQGRRTDVKLNHWTFKLPHMNLTAAQRGWCTVMLHSHGLAYRSRFAAGGSGPRGWDISPSGPEAGSRSSFPGCHCREKTEFIINQLPLRLYHLPPPFLPLLLLLLLTHSSDSRSLVSLSLSLKQPRECMLSRTSGSISSAAASVLMATFLGTGCSGSGSFFPALQHNMFQVNVPALTSRDTHKPMMNEITTMCVGGNRVHSEGDKDQKQSLTWGAQWSHEQWNIQNKSSQANKRNICIIL